MAKTARKSKHKTRGYNPISKAERVSQVNSVLSATPRTTSPNKVSTPPLDVSRYFKKDIAWSIITTLIVVVLLVVVYFIFR